MWASSMEFRAFWRITEKFEGRKRVALKRINSIPCDLIFMRIVCEDAYIMIGYTRRILY